MRTIEPGQTQCWTAKLCCTGAGNEGVGCGALLLVEQADLFITELEFQEFVTFRCHDCGVETDLKPEIAKTVPRPLPHKSEWDRRRHLYHKE